MINPAAVRAFLERDDLKDSSTIKRLSEEQLDKFLANLAPTIRFHTAPKKHQKACVILALRYPQGYAFWPDMGGGKSKIALDLAWHFTSLEPDHRSLILVPYGTQVPEWVEREAPKHRPDLRVTGVVGTPAERQSAFWNPAAQAVVCTYAGFLSMMCVRVAKEDESKGNRMVIDPKQVERALKHFACVFCDEASYLKSHQSIAFRILQRMRHRGLRRLYELTGTPFHDRKPEDLWSQYYLLDGGHTLGETLGLFRAAFFTTKRNFWGGFVYTFKKSMAPILHRFIANRAIRYEAEELDGLPPITGGLVSKKDLLIRYVDLPEDTKVHYRKVVGELREARGNYTETENAWHRMRRLASGYALVKDDDGVEQPYIFPTNPKLDALLELLSEIRMGRQAIVFCVYQFTGKMLVEALRKQGYKVARVYGGQPKREQANAINGFLEGRYNILVASEAAAYGLNLQVANYVFMYESPPSPIIRRQMEKRCHRGDQKHHVWVYDLVMRKTVEVKLIRSLVAGKDLFRSVLRGRSSV